MSERQVSERTRLLQGNQSGESEDELTLPTTKFKIPTKSSSAMSDSTVTENPGSHSVSI